jgi:hypothetical protein
MTLFAVKKSNLALFTTIFFVGCHSASSGDIQKVNVNYWTKTGNESCVKMSGIPYCFLKKDVEAQSFPTDSGAGFLFRVETDDPVLVDCAEDSYRVGWEWRPYPNIKMTVSEARRIDDRRMDTISEKYKRVRENELGKNAIHIVEPRRYIDYFGEKCLQLNEKDLSGREALCHGGDYDKGEVAYFWGCSVDGSVPNPSCKYRFYYKNLEYSVTTSKRCAPFFANKLRDFALKFVDQGRLRALN